MGTKPYKFTVQEANNVAFGANGFDWVTGTESGDWFCFKAVNGNATLSATSAFGDALAATVIQNGDLVFGNFSAVAVTSGAVLAYRN